MVRIRRSERKDEKGTWKIDAYAIERSDGVVLFRYPLSWEHLGAEYNAQIREQKLNLLELEEILEARDLRWDEIQTIDMDYEEVRTRLDRECGIPSPGKILARAA